MRLWNLMVALLSLALTGISSTAWGHGFSISTVSTATGNKLVGVNNGTPTGRDDLFADSWSSSVNRYTATHGGIGVIGGFTGTPNLNIEMLGLLWYSDGSSAVPTRMGLPAQDIEVDGISFNGVNQIGNVNIDGNGPDLSTMAVTGLSTHSIGWVLTPNPVPDGSYGFAYRVIGSRMIGTETEQLIASDPLVVVLSTPGFGGTNATIVNQARDAIYAAATAVPEPSSIALALLATGGAAIAMRRARN